MNDVASGTRLFRAQTFLVLALLLGTTLINLPGRLLSSWDQKWSLVFVATLIALTASLSDQVRSLQIPTLDAWDRGFISAACVGSLVSFLADLPNAHGVRLAERLCFFTLYFYFYNARIKQPSRLGRQINLTSGACIIILAAEFALTYSECQHADPVALRCAMPFFNNRNMFAQALTLHWILFVATLNDGLGVNRRSPLLWAWASVAVVGPVILLARSRTSLVECAAGLAVLMFRGRHYRDRFFWFAGVCLVLVALAGGAVIYRAGLVDSSARRRVQLVRGAVQMIFDHPVGIGLGNYPIFEMRMRPEQTPSSTVLYKSPHNEVLRLAVEEGILTSISAYLFLARRVWLASGVVGPNLATAFGAYFAGETLFQFPFENPFTAVGLAFLLAWSTPKDGARSIALGTLRARVVILMLVLVLQILIARRVCDLIRRADNLRLGLRELVVV